MAGGRVTGVRTEAGEIHAPAVVVCAGLWAPALLAPLGITRAGRAEASPDVLLPASARLRRASRDDRPAERDVHAARDREPDDRRPLHVPGGGRPRPVQRGRRPAGGHAERRADRPALPRHGARAVDGRVLGRLRRDARITSPSSVRSRSTRASTPTSGGAATASSTRRPSAPSWPSRCSRGRPPAGTWRRSGGRGSGTGISCRRRRRPTRRTRSSTQAATAS